MHPSHLAIQIHATFKFEPYPIYVLYSDNIRSYVLTWTECKDFFLCFHCATLPNVVKHPLFLRYGENTEGVYWCGICEKTLDPHKWCYTCDDCSSTLHINYVLALNPSFKFGYTFQEENVEAEMVLNNYVATNVHLIVKVRLSSKLRTCFTVFFISSAICLGFEL